MTLTLNNKSQCSTPLYCLTAAEYQKDIKATIDLAVYLSGAQKAFVLFSKEGCRWLAAESEVWPGDVQDEKALCFCSAIRLVSSSGIVLGEIQLVYTLPYDLDARQQTALSTLAQQLVRSMEMQRETASKQKQVKGKGQPKPERTLLFTDSTSRKQSDEQVKKLSRVVSQSSNAVIFRTRDGQITWVNDAFKRIFGYTPSEAIATYYYDLLAFSGTNPAQLNKAIRNIQTAKRGKVELCLRAKDGREVWVIASLGPYVDEDGSIEGITSIITDITETKLAEKEIRKLSNILSSSSEGVIVRNAKGEVVWLNKSFETISGYRSHELLGKEIAGMFAGPDTDLTALTRAANSRRKGQRVSSELLLYKKTGAAVWIQLLTNPILDEHGNLENVVTTVSDITHRKQNEEKLKLLSMVADKTNVGVTISDNAGRAYWVNQGFVKITGYTIDELRGAFIGDILSGQDTDLNEIKRIRKLARAKKEYSSELLCYKKDGTPFWIAVSGNPVLGKNGKILHGIEIVEDITDQKKAEFELIRAKEEALRLSKAKETFLSVMSHEIRTPLNSIVGLTTLLINDDPTKTQLEYLNLLKFSGEKLNVLINDVLDLTKMETGNLSLECAEVNLKELVSKTINSLQVRADENLTKLMLDVDRGIPALIMADAVRLYQIIMNLVGNAIKFTRNGKVRLKLKMVSETEFDLTVRFTISDTGIGIPRDKIHTIFEPYKQASSDTTRMYGGTGLGLTIVKNLLSLHGSEIQVSSTPGKGSTFTFEITFKKVARGAKNTVGNQKASPASILIVDDEEINRKVAQVVLRNENIMIDTAENGFEAINKIKNKRYDCVLMDLNMPVMNGFEASNTIRKLGDTYYKNLPIIALTGSSDENDRKAIKTSGMNGHILKPFSKDGLLEEILECLKDNS